LLKNVDLFEKIKVKALDNNLIASLEKN
jgi:hypothetical protein